jgi:hypothetical protein
MKMKKYQSKSIHVGNAGEHLVASRLSQYCIVRDVSQGKDTGIDLYCEILKEGSLELSLHFFCQIKTNQRRIDQSEIEKNIDYWANQPVPCFLFLVKYADFENIKDAELWVYDLPYFLAIRDAKKEGIKLQRDVEKTFLICEENNNKDKMTLESFLYGHIPFSYGLWQMRRYGLVLPNPEIRDNVPPVFVGGLTKIYKDKIETAISYGKKLMRKEK